MVRGSQEFWYSAEMDSYAKAAFREAVAKRTPLQVRRDECLNRLVNGPTIYVFALLFYGFWGWVIFELLTR